MRFFDFFLKWISMLTMLYVLGQALFRNSLWLEEYGLFLPQDLVLTLTAGAVGYLTNAMAIWLLFKPYHKHFGFFQGVIPRNQPEMAKEMGEVVSEYLLRPEELSGELCKMVHIYLQDPALPEDLRRKSACLVKLQSDTLTGWMIPHLRSVIHQAIENNLTPDSLPALFDHTVAKYLQKDGLRQKAASELVARIQERSPEITDLLRKNLESGIGEYLRTEHPFLASLQIGKLAPGIMNCINWTRIEEQLREKLGAQEVQDMISSELENLVPAFHARLALPETLQQLAPLLADGKKQAEEAMVDYLKTQLPEILGAILRKEELWQDIGEQVIPALEDYILRRLHREEKKIVESLDLKSRVELKVAGMEPEQLHKMLLRASAKHLTAIQVLGYILGAAAGIILMYTN